MPKLVNDEVVMSSFDTLYAVDCSTMTEKKKVGGTELTYLSWSDAWALIMKMFPDASYEFVLWDQPDGTKKFYNLDETGAFVMTKVTIDGTERVMMLPVMDGANKAMKKEPYFYKVKNSAYKFAKPNAQGIMVDKNGQPVDEYIQKTVDAISSMDVNKTLMRCLVKNLAMFGLGLYIYSGEDLPGTPDEEDLTKLLKKFNETRSALADLEVDVHSSTFNDWLMRKANIHNTDPGVLLNFPAEMKRAIAEMERAIEKKKNSGQ
jgi:hypothetical protein